MKIEILFFGHLTEISNCSSVFVDNPGSIAQLKELLFRLYPSLSSAKFTIALNNKMAFEEEPIPENAKLACMPPFSGG